MDYNYTIGVQNQNNTVRSSYVYWMDITQVAETKAAPITRIITINKANQPSTHQQNTELIIDSPVNNNGKKTLANQGLTMQEIFLNRLHDIFEEHYQNEDLDVRQIATLMQMSYTQFYRKLKKMTHQTPAKYLRLFRLEKAKWLLSNPSIELNVSEIAYEVGFTDPNYFTRSFGALFGESPNSLRKTNNY